MRKIWMWLRPNLCTQVADELDLCERQLLQTSGMKEHIDMQLDMLTKRRDRLRVRHAELSDAKEAAKQIKDTRYKEYA